MSEYLAPYTEAKDYAVQFKIKNGPMLQAMRLNGFENAAQLSRVCKVGQQCIGRFLNLKYPPLTKKGKWLRSIIKIANTLKVAPDLLFPQQHLTKILERNTSEVFLSLEEIKAVTQNLVTDGPEVLMIEGEKFEKLKEAMDCLTKQERTVIEGRFYALKLESLEELGQKLNVSRERIRQVQEKALWKMRNRFRRIYPEYKE